MNLCASAFSMWIVPEVFFSSIARRKNTASDRRRIVGSLLSSFMRAPPWSRTGHQPDVLKHLSLCEGSPGARIFVQELCCSAQVMRM
jgi:hypothetical protein